MFGTLQPHSCRLNPHEELNWRRFYCGACKPLGEQHGTLIRATLSHHAVFVAIVDDALSDTPAPQDACRCVGTAASIPPLQR